MDVKAYTKDGIIEYFVITAAPWEYFVLQDAVYEYGWDREHDYKLLDQLRAVKMNEDWFKKELKEIGDYTNKHTRKLPRTVRLHIFANHIKRKMGILKKRS